MSIPPLVCSTPPPPEQCEDDKDPEDFDLHYNLSQDDEYDYGSFSTYSHFQSAISESKPLESPIINKTNISVNISDNSEKDNVKKKNEELQWSKESAETTLHHNNEEPETDVKTHRREDDDFENKSIIAKDLCFQNKLDNEELHIDKKSNIEEEPHVEDLNLYVDEGESICSNLKDELYEDTLSDKFDSTSKVKEIEEIHIPNIPDMPDSINEITVDQAVSSLDNITLSSTMQEINEDIQLNNEGKHTESDIKIEHNLELSFDDGNAINTDILGTGDPLNVAFKVNSETDDEFGDIHEFHVTSENKDLNIDTCENPWGKTQPSSDFGAFEANFDEAESLEPSSFQAFEEKIDPVNKNEFLNLEDDDDFGDFDDFKSSTQETTDKEKNLDPLSQIPVLNFHTSETESQVHDNINKVLNEIFVEEVPVPESVFDAKLESLLCETWGHLLETDVRQPYIVNWNNSFGQKSLLKALCIDSRNILFGPKWSCNMPKYAANLSAAPLQPQKQAAAAAPDSEPRDAARPPAAYTDPFTADGQQFTYAEALLLDLEHLMATLDQMAHNHSNLKISDLLSHACNKENNTAAQNRPSDLNVLDFASTMPSKSEKIYSSTHGIQPLRQISLPDTHIFTPTDSETPRSKTIHYDEPSVFLPQAPVENVEISTEILNPSSQMELKTGDNEDYSDFQDFKASFTANVTQSIPAREQPADSTELPDNMKQLLTASTTYPAGILQPIKLEPSIPTLNWPSPGEVKETFDDFSEFASNTTWSNEPQASNTEAEKIQTTYIENCNTIKIDDVLSNKNSFDDEFDTFQSALPTSSIAPTVSSSNSVQESMFGQNIPAQPISNIEVNIDFSFSDIHTVKSEPISLTKPIDILKHSESSINYSTPENAPKPKETFTKNPLSGALSMPATVLQPISSAPLVQQNTTQILQPLSLESFSQINWPSPGIDLQDLSRFNPVETLHSLKSDLSMGGHSKGASPIHNQKNSTHNQEDDIWGEFVSSKPKPQQSLPKKVTSFVDDDEWTDFVSSPAVKPQNGLSTISLNVHTNLNLQKSTKQSKMTIQNNQALEIPTLNYITPKSSNHSSYNDRHFQNL